MQDFTISSSSPIDKSNSLGIFSPTKRYEPETKSREWRIAQWGTRLPIYPSDFKMTKDNLWIAENDCKRIEIYFADSGSYLKLFCKGISELNGRLRKYGEPWPHLLIEYKFSPIISPANSKIGFEIKFRITNCTVDPNLLSKIDNSLHTAQITAYWTIANKNPNSNDYNDYFWFGIPLFDYRYPIPPKYFDLDKGAPTTTNKLIYVVDGNTLWKEPTGDGKEKYLNISLSPIIKNAIKEIKDKGFFVNSNISDFYLTSFNLGWEITGPFNAEVEITKLNFTAKIEGD